MTDHLTENARLRAALEPFAMIADLIDEETEGVSTTDEFGLFFLNGESDEPVWFAERFSVQKFKEARAALATPAPDAPDLTDPVVVHANMLRGTIAKPTVAQIIHLYGSAVFLELKARAALATPAPDAVQEAARVPEIAALIEAADNLMLNYLQDELCEPDLCVDEEHWAAIHDLNTALRAISGGQP